MRAEENQEVYEINEKDWLEVEYEEKNVPALKNELRELNKKDYITNEQLRRFASWMTEPAYEQDQTFLKNFFKMELRPPNEGNGRKVLEAKELEENIQVVQKTVSDLIITINDFKKFITKDEAPDPINRSELNTARAHLIQSYETAHAELTKYINPAKILKAQEGLIANTLALNKKPYPSDLTKDQQFMEHVFHLNLALTQISKNEKIDRALEAEIKEINKPLNQFCTTLSLQQAMAYNKKDNTHHLVCPIKKDTFDEAKNPLNYIFQKSIFNSFILFSPNKKECLNLNLDSSYPVNKEKRELEQLFETLIQKGKLPKFEYVFNHNLHDDIHQKIKAMNTRIASALVAYREGFISVEDAKKLKDDLKVQLEALNQLIKKHDLLNSSSLINDPNYKSFCEHLTSLEKNLKPATHLKSADQFDKNKREAQNNRNELVLLKNLNQIFQKNPDLLKINQLLGRNGKIPKETIREAVRIFNNHKATAWQRMFGLAPEKVKVVYDEANNKFKFIPPFSLHSEIEDQFCSKSKEDFVKLLSDLINEEHLTAYQKRQPHPEQKEEDEENEHQAGFNLNPFG